MRKESSGAGAALMKTTAPEWELGSCLWQQLRGRNSGNLSVALLCNPGYSHMIVVGPVKNHLKHSQVNKEWLKDS